MANVPMAYVYKFREDVHQTATAQMAVNAKMANVCSKSGTLARIPMPNVQTASVTMAYVLPLFRAKARVNAEILVIVIQTASNVYNTPKLAKNVTQMDAAKIWSASMMSA